MEKKRTPFLIAGVVLVIMFIVLVFARLNREPMTNSNWSETLHNEVSPSADLNVDFESHRLYLFGSETCPHCAQVDEFLASEPTMAATLDLVKVSLDSGKQQADNRNKLIDFASICGQDTGKVGIPFLYDSSPDLPDDQRCHVGDTIIINYIQDMQAKTQDN